jgi:hypothetical protein
MIKHVNAIIITRSGCETNPPCFRDPFCPNLGRRAGKGDCTEAKLALTLQLCRGLIWSYSHHRTQSGYGLAHSSLLHVSLPLLPWCVSSLSCERSRQRECANNLTSQSLYRSPRRFAARPPAAGAWAFFGFQGISGPVALPCTLYCVATLKSHGQGQGSISCAHTSFLRV